MRVADIMTVFSDHDFRLDVSTLRRIAQFLRQQRSSMAPSRATTLAGIERLLSSAGVGAWLRSNACTWPAFFAALPGLCGVLPAEELLQLIPLKKARYYSIASSPRRMVGLLDVLVGLSGDEAYPGQASSFLHSARTGDGVDFRIVRVPSFRLSVTRTAPSLCVSVGLCANAQLHPRARGADCGGGERGS